MANALTKTGNGCNCTSSCLCIPADALDGCFPDVVQVLKCVQLPKSCYGKSQRCYIEQPCVCGCYSPKRAWDGFGQKGTQVPNERGELLFPLDVELGNLDRIRVVSSWNKPVDKVYELDGDPYPQAIVQCVEVCLVNNGSDEDIITQEEYDALIAEAAVNDGD